MSVELSRVQLFSGGAAIGGEQDERSVGACAVHERDGSVSGQGEREGVSLFRQTVDWFDS